MKEYTALQEHRLKLLIGVCVTSLAVAFAFFGGRSLWRYYNMDPWTRDGKVRADIVRIGPDINGLITEVRVRDNQQVKIGQVLFLIDPQRYALALKQAEASIDGIRAALDQAERTARRNRNLGNLATTEQVEESLAHVAQLRAQLEAAVVQKNTAQLNLDRTLVRSTVNGIVTNMEVQPGDYAAAGHQVLAIVNTDSLYVNGYFEETKLPRIRIGDRADVRIMGVGAVLHGKVEGIAAGIEDRERGPSGSALANVNPTFSWVRLAQRIPVRVHLEDVPKSVRLIAGRTATVSIETPRGRAEEGAEP